MKKLIEHIERIANSLERLALAQERIANSLESEQLPEKGDQKLAAIALGVSPRTIARNQEQWIEGIHYCRHGRRVVYNLSLLRDWQQNINNPREHEQTIKQWQRNNKIRA